MKKILFALASAILLLAGCKPSKKKIETPAMQEPEPAAVPHTGFELDERLMTADSAVIVFYDDPFGKDSLRYTRFYKQHSTTDTVFIQALLSALRMPFAKLEKVKQCRTEGKLWLFTKGKIFQTVYFAWNRSSCSYLYLIKDGFFYYLDIQQPFIDKLLTSKSLAKTP